MGETLAAYLLGVFTGGIMGGLVAYIRGEDKGYVQGVNDASQTFFKRLDRKLSKIDRLRKQLREAKDDQQEER